MSRRGQIRMSPEEVASFLGEQRTVTCATLGPRGWPHLMPLWYVLSPALPDPSAQSSARGSVEEPGPRVWAWTYAVSQKVRNLERDARATLQVEAGEQYQELRGVMLECEVVVHRELKTVAAIGQELFRRYAPHDGEPAEEKRSADPAAADPPSPDMAAVFERQAAKRVALEFVELRRATWDHRKLAGVY